ncbi:hypothetical protein BDN72DRAFT_842556 [Pluteus cervinus]|uniref:Uncharacterized protein n=1 Tax=Pluteus cervinus TaxID=181527 RepID=A0ACD3AR63_9AGAR|nr:hypothetical protein BDN72DRAFT_842556 [Pluteus cervinus]
MTSLPSELLDGIFRQIYTECSPKEFSGTLVNCYLVCGRWKQIAQPVLLSEFPIHGHHYNPQSFIRTLLSYPHLQRQVKSLYVHIPVWMNTKMGAEVNLTLLTKLGPNMRRIVFAKIDMEMIDIPSAILSSDQLIRLSISEVLGFPVSLLSQCSAL